MATQQPVNLESLGQTINELFPAAATPAEMFNWFGTNIPANPITAILQTISFDQQRPYTPISSVPAYGIPMSDTQSHTVLRESHYFIVHHGDRQQYDPNNQATHGSVSPNIQANAMPLGTPDHNHWSYHYGQAARGPHPSKTWYQQVRLAINKSNSDFRGSMTEAARKVWQTLDPQTGSVWFNPVIVNNMVRIMLHYISANQDETPAIIDFLLGSRITHFDVEALYAARRNGTSCYVTNPNTPYNPPVDLFPILAGWLELSCAHMLTEVFMNHWYISPATKASRDALRKNYQYIARVNPHRRVLEANVGCFPYK